jgi:hypothetical protein
MYESGVSLPTAETGNRNDSKVLIRQKSMTMKDEKWFCSSSIYTNHAPKGATVNAAYIRTVLRRFVKVLL